MSDTFRVEPAEEHESTCACCGNRTRTVWGYVYASELPLACYWIQWTASRPDHPPNFDFLIGTWGNDEVNDKQLVSWLFNPSSGGGSFMAIDSASRPAARSTLCAKALTRQEVVNNGALMQQATDLIDAVWLGDPRLLEVREFAE
ncbi:hypothetical protein [Viridibacterium curvum]|uniref:Uncharacterized protein n=1 Tax=Viridibacterium curvum TaxID=1101404 RepID=A0ABP9QHP6_9RHOO